MRLDTVSRHPAHLTYCLNVHPGESWAEAFAAIRVHALAVRDWVAPGQRFGLGLRLSAGAAAELDGDRKALAEFRKFLRENTLYVFTVNGFPYGRFHGVPVKEQVYAPDWRDPRRLEYTLRLGRILAALLPRGVPGSISTLPGSYRAWIRTAADEADVLTGLCRAAAGLAEIRRRTGRTIMLAIEPEPDCLWERTGDLVRLWRLLRGPGLTPKLAPLCGLRTPDLRHALERHLGVCMDACHAAVNFERPAEVLKRLAAERIPVAKIQISAAPAGGTDPETVAELAALAEPVYLHQTRVRAADGAVTAFADLEPALAAVGRAEIPHLQERRDAPSSKGGQEAPSPSEIRTHFHIPLGLERLGRLRSTRDELDAVFFALLRAGATRHIELETYTFSVLPEPIRRDGVAAMLAAEFAWFLREWSPA